MVKEYHEPWSPTSNVPSSVGSSSGRTAGGTPKPPPPLPPSVARAAAKGTIGPEELRQVFRTIDKDNSGEISHQELRYALWSLTGTKPTKAVTNVILADIDTDNNGVVDEDEFIEFFSTVNTLKTLREDIIVGEQKAGAVMWFVNVYGACCIVATMLFFLLEIESDDPDFGGNWGLFVFGIMSLIWLFFRVIIPLLMARISYWVPILRDIQKWFYNCKRKICRFLKNVFRVAKHWITGAEGDPPVEPGTPLSPTSPTLIAMRSLARMKSGKKPEVKTPYSAEHYQEAAEHQQQSGQMPLHTFKLLGKNTATRGPTTFAADQPVYFLPYNQWDGGDLKAKVAPQEAWPSGEQTALPAIEGRRLPMPALEAPNQEPKSNMSRFKALVSGEALASNLESSPKKSDPGSAMAVVEQALEDRQHRREVEASAPSLA
eukprot:gnl/MRDRNA2_/MRDRNA2_117931_c0_seq1.p1 gnl/MRDRNA2_/MRDRNA2_117931_c0~~gnl/MRDRNA2_/MRDRNA2_117931_c0_seq1.p1  ORF type:complete len:431 (-),score=69.45 gnl/MRDRNA2_/MRDRNA2_117931_c0_seq1:21-1313(-)